MSLTDSFPAMSTDRFHPLRNIAISVVLIASIAGFVATVDQHYALTQWLVWRYLGYWIAALVWALSCCAVGLFLLRVLRFEDQDNDILAWAFPLGVFAFHLAVFLLGLVHLLHGSVFFLLPIACIVIGGRELQEQLCKHWRTRASFSHVRLFAVAYGVYCVGLLYFQVLSPETFSHDARWYHLPIAQQYAIDGAVKPWPEGWWLAAYPHLSSYLYSWAFLLPRGLVFDHFELCAHVELVVFLATIASIPPLVRRIVPNANARSAWLAVFLFPGIFLYDSNLNVGADHIAALWAIPIVLSLLRVWSHWKLRDGLLFSVFISAAVLTKYSAVNIIVPPVVALVIRAAFASSRRGIPWKSRVKPLAALTAIGFTSLVLTTPHWLKNWVWYGDPLYPILNEHLHVHPWNSDSPAHFQLFRSMLGTGVGTNSSSLGEALEAAVTFSFRANDWPVLHGKVPVFGSLFTLCAACLPFLAASGRLWSLCFMSMASVSIWYWISPQARYLQDAVPWMAACLAACLLLLWQRCSNVVRGLVVALVGVQILWGSDVPFFPTHNMIHMSPFRAVTSFLASGFLKTEHRFRFYGDTGNVGAQLPEGTNLLLHNTYAANFGVHVVNDIWQGGLNYGELGSPAAIYRKLSDLGVTHAVWSTNKGLDWTSLAHDLAFANFALNHIVETRTSGDLSFGKLPSRSPPGQFNDRVAMSTCGHPFRSGWYTLKTLGDARPGLPKAQPYAPLRDVQAAVKEAGFIVVDPRCSAPLPQGSQEHFYEPYSRGSTSFYVRRARL